MNQHQDGRNGPAASSGEGLRTPDFVRDIATELQLRPPQVRATLKLLDEGNTIPFIARYRKEMTGELDEVQLRAVAATYESATKLFARKTEVLRLLEEHGALADEAQAASLRSQLQGAETLGEVEDIYRPFRPKRRTRASMARDKGLEPLADWLMEARPRTPLHEVRKQADAYVSADKGVDTAEDALAGACDILAERWADDPSVRGTARSTALQQGLLRSTGVEVRSGSAKDAAAELAAGKASGAGDVGVYEAYLDYREPVSKAPPHRVLAINRGEQEGVLKVGVELPTEKMVHEILAKCAPGSGAGRTRQGRAASAAVVTEPEVLADVFESIAEDAWKRLIAPSVERETRAWLTEKAEEQAIHVFGENLRQLLLQPPLRGRAVLGVDPAYRTGCKLAVVDDTGKLLEIAVIYPTPPQKRIGEAKEVVTRFVTQHGVGLIAIGNGTASREAELFIADCVQDLRTHHDLEVAYVIVSEAGASVYSASELAAEEFPKLDVSERSAVSIARRIQDPLAELVKIEPKAIGVGQYQHDVSQKRLGEQLGVVVESAVNSVGVDVNTASPSLLSYVAGLNRTAARKIVEVREEKGRFRTRAELKKVPRLGPKTLEQCIGFLRVPGGANVLDATPIHPESYAVVEHLLEATGTDGAVLSDGFARSAWLADVRETGLAAWSERIGVGIPTLRDILEALDKPGRDPREDVAAPLLRTDVLTIDDLGVGMELTGTVRNVVDFGAFVDIGLKNDGLVHISEISNQYVKHPLDVVAVGDIVQVRVVHIDKDRGRIGLSMRIEGSKA